MYCDYCISRKYGKELNLTAVFEGIAKFTNKFYYFSLRLVTAALVTSTWPCFAHHCA